ncbi:MAG: hypothetical protein ACOYOS_13400 [Syntrophales bacterium]
MSLGDAILVETGEVLDHYGLNYDLSKGVQMMGKSRLFCMFVSALVISLSLSACGGGGGGGGETTAAPTPTTTPTPIGTAVSLATIKGFFMGTAPAGSQMSFELTGSDTAGNTFSETLSFASDGPTTFEGNNVTKCRVLDTLRSTADGSSITDITTRYYLTSDGYLYKMVSSSGETAVPTAQTLLPDIAHVGDFGNRWNLTIPSTGAFTFSYQSSTWKLEADINGKSKFKFSSTTTTAGGVIQALSDTTYYLDSAGNPYKVSSTLITNKIHLTMSGNRSQ